MDGRLAEDELLLAEHELVEGQKGGGVAAGASARPTPGARAARLVLTPLGAAADPEIAQGGGEVAVRAALPARRHAAARKGRLVGESKGARPVGRGHDRRCGERGAAQGLRLPPLRPVPLDQVHADAACALAHLLLLGLGRRHPARQVISVDPQAASAAAAALVDGAARGLGGSCGGSCAATCARSPCARSPCPATAASVGVGVVVRLLPRYRSHLGGAAARLVLATDAARRAAPWGQWRGQAGPRQAGPGGAGGGECGLGGGLGVTSVGNLRRLRRLSSGAPPPSLLLQKRPAVRRHGSRPRAVASLVRVLWVGAGAP